MEMEKVYAEFKCMGPMQNPLALLLVILFLFLLGAPTLKPILIPTVINGLLKENVKAILLICSNHVLLPAVTF